MQMDPNTANLIYSMSFILFFDLILLVSLSYYYRKLGYRYLKFGAAAVGVEMFSQLVFYIGTLLSSYSIPYVLGGIAKVVFAALMLVCIAHLVERKVPLRLMLLCVLLYLGESVFVAITGEFNSITWVAVEIPSVIMLLLGIFYLLSIKQPASIARAWLAGLLVVHIVLKMMLPFVSQESMLFMMAYFYNAIVLTMTGAVLVMTVSERVIHNLDSQNIRLEEFELENRRLELQFTQAQKLESLGVMAGGIAHDFNNMLTSILGYASLAMKKLPTESDVRKDLYMVMSGARQAVDLTSQMLTYAGKGAIEFESLDISRVVDNMSSLINSIVPRKIRLVQKVSRSLPVMKGDQIQLGQVLMNLVANGVDAIEDKPGVIEISTGITEVGDDLLRNSFYATDLEEGAYLYLKVKDSGRGMDSSEFGKIFDPFYSDKNTRKGLGLSSLLGIVRQHKGFMHVSSHEGEGSEFSAYFPIVSFHDTDGDANFVIPPGEGDVKGRVLLAEDDPRIRSLIASILESDGFQLDSVEDGKEATKYISEKGESCVIFVLDCTMPKMSGTEVYRHIRSQGLATPVLLISGYHEEQVVANISNDPDAYFIKKPFNVDGLLESVNSAIKNQAKKLA
jgi:signal transduction histidine kinase/CheY-like chemotaxis protein